MSLTNLSLLGATTYGQASGNYDGSSMDFAGTPVTAANYYAGQGAIQTVTINVSDFVGMIYVEATLNDTEQAASWFRTDIFGDGITPVTEIHPITVLGNFVYMRVRVLGFDGGTINSITLSY